MVANKIGALPTSPNWKGQMLRAFALPRASYGWTGKVPQAQKTKSFDSLVHNISGAIDGVSKDLRTFVITSGVDLTAALLQRWAVSIRGRYVNGTIHPSQWILEDSHTLQLLRTKLNQWNWIEESNGKWRYPG